MSGYGSARVKRREAEVALCLDHWHSKHELHSDRSEAILNNDQKNNQYQHMEQRSLVRRES